MSLGLAMAHGLRTVVEGDRRTEAQDGGKRVSESAEGNALESDPQAISFEIVNAATNGGSLTDLLDVHDDARGLLARRAIPSPRRGWRRDP